MADPIGVLGGVAAAVADVQKTLGSLKAIEDQLNKARSVVCTILNVTDQTLIFAGAHQDHGGFATNPPPTIAPRSAAAFGAQSSAGAIATGAEGTVNYGLPGGTLHFHWDDPFAGGNSASAALDGDQGRFATWSNAGAGDQNAQMQFVVFERTFQNDWRFCDKCNGMFFDGFASKGVCPGGPPPGHHAAGLVFSVLHDSPALGAAQADWRFCHKCNGMFFDGFVAKGTCPQGGSHDAAGFNFVLSHDPPRPSQQPNWCFCHKCSGLFFNGFPQKGKCPQGGQHEAQGLIFSIDHN